MKTVVSLQKNDGKLSLDLPPEDATKPKTKEGTAIETALYYTDILRQKQENIMMNKKGGARNY